METLMYRDAGSGNNEFGLSIQVSNQIPNDIDSAR